MKIAIIGSREKYLAAPWIVKQQVREYVEDLPRDTIIVSGGARGVDSYAEQAARGCGLPLTLFLADWATHGKAAGFIRNKLVVDEADRVVAFWDGESRGTANALKQARVLGKQIEIFTVERVGHE